MKLRLRPRSSWRLSRIAKRLRKIEEIPEPEIDLTEARAEISRMIKELPADYVSYEIARHLENYIETYEKSLLRAVRKQDRKVANKLDELSAKLLAYLAEARDLHGDVHGQLSVIDGVVMNTFDRVAKPDTVFFDPTARPENKEGQ